MNASKIEKLAPEIAMNLEIAASLVRSGTIGGFDSLIDWRCCVYPELQRRRTVPHQK